MCRRTTTPANCQQVYPLVLPPRKLLDDTPPTYQKPSVAFCSRTFGPRDRHRPRKLANTRKSQGAGLQWVDGDLCRQISPCEDVWHSCGAVNFSCDGRTVGTAFAQTISINTEGLGVNTRRLSSKRLRPVTHLMHTALTWFNRHCKRASAYPTGETSGVVTGHYSLGLGIIVRYTQVTDDGECVSSAQEPPRTDALLACAETGHAPFQNEAPWRP